LALAAQVWTPYARQHERRRSGAQGMLELMRGLRLVVCQGRELVDDLDVCGQFIGVYLSPLVYMHCLLRTPAGAAAENSSAPVPPMVVVYRLQGLDGEVRCCLCNCSHRIVLGRDRLVAAVCIRLSQKNGQSDDSAETKTVHGVRSWEKKHAVKPGIMVRLLYIFCVRSF
jgi:hypothetical protein